MLFDHFLLAGLLCLAALVEDAFSPDATWPAEMVRWECPVFWGVEKEGHGEEERKVRTEGEEGELQLECKVNKLINNLKKWMWALESLCLGSNSSFNICQQCDLETWQKLPSLGFIISEVDYWYLATALDTILSMSHVSNTLINSHSHLMKKQISLLPLTN